MRSMYASCEMGRVYLLLPSSTDLEEEQDFYSLGIHRDNSPGDGPSTGTEGVNRDIGDSRW